jgi:broad specificity phosphatase PhoE
VSAVLFLLLLAPVSGAAADTVVYVVRHAEKVTDGPDPALSAAGLARAATLAERLADAGLHAIHSTDYRRTRDTAEPLARRVGLAVRLYDPERPEALAAAIARAGGRHLVVGHSNTVPELVERLGGDGGAPIDEANEYDRLYVVIRPDDGPVRTVLHRYGARFSP